VTELISGVFRAERAVSPLDGSVLWVVLDPELVAHREASDFLRALDGAGRSPNTIRVYAGRVAGFLGWCTGQGVAWSSVSLAELARFKHFVEVTPGRGGWLRSGATVNATLTAVCEFLRFCARTGLIEAAVAERLSEPRWLRFTPPGFDAGESGQFRTVRARALKARAQVPFPEALTSEQAGAVLACCRRPRERFMVILLLDTGLRIGEALGLRRTDMHLLPRFPQPGLRDGRGAHPRPAPGQRQRGAGQVPFPAHRPGQRRGARQLCRLPARAGGDPR
jgi:integrase/recombinase XerD